MMNIGHVNKLDKKELKKALLKCCASEKWAAELVDNSPFKGIEDLFFKSKKIWFGKCEKTDWLEAFLAHPKIGDIDTLAKKYGSTKKWSSNEQAGVDSADLKTLEELSEKNNIYEKKYGYIFIVCATGKSAKEMLDILNDRLKNNPRDEIKIAMQEQHKITKIRLEKWLMVNGK